MVPPPALPSISTARQSSPLPQAFRAYCVDPKTFLPLTCPAEFVRNLTAATEASMTVVPPAALPSITTARQSSPPTHGIRSTFPTMLSLARNPSTSPVTSDGWSPWGASTSLPSVTAGAGARLTASAWPMHIDSFTASYADAARSSLTAKQSSPPPPDFRSSFKSVSNVSVNTPSSYYADPETLLPLTCPVHEETGGACAS